jgi:hypothetical protein
MVSLWTAVPQSLDDLLSRGDVAAASELYDPQASLVCDGATLVHGRQAVREALGAFQDTIAIRYYVRRLRVARPDLWTARGEPQTHTALGWCVRTTSGIDEAIEQHYERVWNRDWRVVAEHRTTTRERLPAGQRRLIIRTPRLAQLCAEVLEDARESDQRFDYHEFAIHHLPEDLAEHVRRVAAVYPFAALAVLLQHSLRHGVIRMSPWHFAWPIRRAASRAVIRQGLPALGVGTDIRQVLRRQIDKSVSEFEQAGAAATRHDLVRSWLEDRVVAEFSTVASPPQASDDVVHTLRQSAYWLVDPLYQSWLRRLEQAGGFHWLGESPTTLCG